MPKILFGDDSDGDEVVQQKEEFVVNEGYAKSYDQWRRKEEYQKLKDKYGDVDDLESESSSEDDYVEPDNPEFDDEFYKVITALKSRDPKVHEKEFFTQSFAIPTKKEDKEKPMTLRDLERKRLIEGGGQLEDSDEEIREFDNVVGQSMKSKLQRKAGKEEGKSKVVGFKDDGIGGSGDENDELLTKNIEKISKSKKKKSKSSADVGAWKAKDKSEKWLKDFFVNKRYLESDSEGEEEDEEEEKVIDEETISDDEETLEEMEDFSAKYNFRFLEPDGHTIRSYPREIKGSIREKSNKRKIERENAASRKREQKETRLHEIILLKEMKQKEILDKIEKLKEISGNENIDALANELKEDFDPEKHEETMKAMFSADYYDETEDNDNKPIFPDDDDGDMYKDYDDWMEKNPKYKDAEEADDESEDKELSDANDEDDDRPPKSKSKLKNKPPKFAEVLSKNKRQFDPSIETFEKYYDEYYKLEFEDIVAGMPVRFNYKKVEPNSFGLTTEEILSSKDAELNKWYSLTKILRYNRTHGQEMSDAQHFADRAQMQHVKYRYLPSLFTEAPEDALEAEMEKKRLKNKNKKLRKQAKKEAIVEEKNKKYKVANGEETSPKNKNYIESRVDVDVIPQKKVFADAEVDEVTVSKKKKKKHKNITDDDVISEKNHTDITDEVDVAPKKKKKHRELVEDSDVILKHTDAADEEVIVSKKKKKKKLTDDAVPEDDGVSKKKKKRVEPTDDEVNVSKKKKRKHTDETVPDGDEDTVSKKKKKDRETSDDVDVVVPKKKRKMENGKASGYKDKSKNKHMKKPKLKSNTYLDDISDERLRALGANPKRIRGKMKYKDSIE